jgi:hypothetical protein
MATADSDRNDRQREIGARTARVERQRQRFVDTGPAPARIGANIAVILFVVVQLMGFDEWLDGVRQRLTRVCGRWAHFRGSGGVAGAPSC